MHILYLTKDLLFSSRICSMASQQGATVNVVSKVDEAEAADPALAILDLSLPALDIPAVVEGTS